MYYQTIDFVDSVFLLINIVASDERDKDGYAKSNKLQEGWGAVLRKKSFPTEYRDSQP